MFRALKALFQPQFALESVSNPLRMISTSASVRKAEDRKRMMKSVPKMDEGTSGEKTQDLDFTRRGGMFPDEDTPTTLFDGVPFMQLPIIHIKVSKNNTLITCTDYKGKPHYMHSCGKEGFKNCRKGTNVAAQATGISAALKAMNNGVKNVRILIQGLGPGRMASLKGLQMGGINVVSLTDITAINWHNNPRPKKQRRL